MGNSLTEQEQSKQTSLTPYGDIFDELFPHYLLMGMTPEQYWDGEYGLKTAYRKAYTLRLENEQRISDRNNWYMGQYIIAALQAVPLFVGGFNTKGVNIPSYPDKPFFQQEEERKKKEQEEERKKEEVRKKNEEDQSKLAMAMFQAMTTKFNKNIEKRLAKAANEGSGQ